MRLFNRVLRLTLGEGGSSGIMFTTENNNLAPRIRFEISKTNGVDPNTATVTVTNANKTILDALPQGTDFKNQVMMIEAGYENDAGIQLAYVGSITNIELHLQRPDNEVVITANDGYDVLVNKKFGKSYIKETKKKDVLSDIVQNIGIPLDGMGFSEMADDLFNGGFTASGGVGESLDTVTKALKLRWSIQGGKIRIVPYTGSTANELVKARVLNAQTGMIGSPEKIIDPDKGIGYRAYSLFMPSVEPDDMLVVDDLGTFRVYKISSHGDTYGSDNTSEILVFSK